MTMTNKFPFTKTRLESLPVPPQDGRRIYYYDSKQDGLCLCVTAAGTRTFYLYRWSNGRPVRIPLGKFPGVTVEQARKAAQTLIGEMAKGHDPQATRQAIRHEQTIEGLFAYWLECAKQRRIKTWTADERRYCRFLKPWANRRLSTIRKTDVQNLFTQAATNNGRYAANRLLALLKAMFNKAADMGFLGSNPTTGVKKFPEEKRDRFLHGDDLRSFFASLAEEQNTLLQHLFMLLLFTGARRSNVQAMRWDEIDFATAAWRIPETKSGLPVVVPLTPVALAILRDRKEAANGTPWVFPSRGHHGHIVEPKSAWKRIIKRAGLADVRPHDLRRSLASWMAIGGASLPLIGKMLGHTQASTTAIYARLSVDPVRQAAEKAEADMLHAAGLEWEGGKLLQS